MALTIIEQIDYANTNIAGGVLDVRAVIRQLAVQEATSFLRATKLVDPATNPDAEAYKNKMINLCSKAITGNSNVVVSLVRVMFAVINLDTSFTKAQVDGATQAQVLTFFENNIRKAFEAVANCDAQEVADYNSIP
jgi:hypothetical protein